MKISPGRSFLAVVDVLVGALLVYGGALEAVSYWRHQPVVAIVGLLGAVTGAGFFVSGLALWTRRSNARTLAVVSCVALIAVHATAWQMGLLGVPAIALAIIYPALRLLSLWRARHDALPAGQSHTNAPRIDRKDDLLKRVAVHEAL